MYKLYVLVLYFVVAIYLVNADHFELALVLAVVVAGILGLYKEK